MHTGQKSRYATGSCHELDEKAIKKKIRNRQSAQRARDRQKARMKLLETEIQNLLRKNQILLQENTTLRKYLARKNASPIQFQEKKIGFLPNQSIIHGKVEIIGAVKTEQTEGDIEEDYASDEENASFCAPSGNIKTVSAAKEDSRHHETLEKRYVPSLLQQNEVKHLPTLGHYPLPQSVVPLLYTTVPFRQFPNRLTHENWLDERAAMEADVDSRAYEKYQAKFNAQIPLHAMYLQRYIGERETILKAMISCGVIPNVIQCSTMDNDNKAKNRDGSGDTTKSKPFYTR